MGYNYIKFIIFNMRQLWLVAILPLFFLSPIDTLAQSKVAKSNIRSVDQPQENVGKTFSRDKASLVISFIKLKLLVNNDDF